MPGYIKSRVSRSLSNRIDPGRPVRVWLAIADHYEPYWRNTDDAVARSRVAAWRRLWPEIAVRHQDENGLAPKYSFYYPEEEYRPWLLEPLAEMTRQGIADVEVHIHHDGEGEQNFLDRMSWYIGVLSRDHGLLHREDGKLVFGFIHGNWALDNSRPDGQRCGLNNEITLLRNLGCYADFTMPCGAHPSQARTVNQIYWAIDDPDRPRSYDFGTHVLPGRMGTGDLLMVPGPLGLRWRERMVPRLEAGEVAHQDRPTPYRVKRWLDLAPRIGNDIFIKLYTHGTQERNSKALLEEGALDDTFRLAKQECQKRGYQLCFASTWDMYRAIRAAAGATPAEAA